MHVVIPDIHEDWQKAGKIIAKYIQHPMIFLGDWFDSFTHTDFGASRTLDLLLDVARVPTSTLLWGNHDIHYAWVDVGGIHCSGFSLSTLRIVDHRIPIDRFKLSVVSEGFVLSHAGWTYLPRDHQQEYIDQVWQDALDLLAAKVYPSLFRAGARRGGEPNELGGPVWLDWRDFKPLSGIKQIVGHTLGKTVRWNDGNVCLDTDLKHVALIDNGQIEIVPV